jgi:choline dehydrogenase-like flavoprotein
MLDAGRQLPPKQQGLMSSMQREHPASWEPRRSQDALQKRRFDSPYMYETPGLDIATDKARASASFARGGLSSVWGAAMLPYERSDMRGWPEIDLEPWYRKVLSFVPLAGAEDALAERFPLYAKPDDFQISGQAQAMLEHCGRHADRLRENGFVIGRSRLAVRVFPDKERSGCVYCGLCMSGCPHDLIYSAEQTLSELRHDAKFSYRNGVVVKRLRESDGVAEVLATQGGEEVRYSGRKVFMAAGVFSTTRVMLHSKNRDEVPVRDSQYVIIPCLAKKRGQAGRQHALSQLFIEYRDEKLGNVHMQFYPFSDLIAQGVAEKLGFLHSPLEPVLRPLVQRLVVIQAFLHSDVSGSLMARLTPSGLSLEGIADSRGRRFQKILFRHASKLGLLPLPPLVEWGLPGQGFHSGGSFPMSDDPGAADSDVLGRCGFENIHLVDSSVLPSIAGTTITLTEMANAFRIADTVSGRSE